MTMTMTKPPFRGRMTKPTKPVGAPTGTHDFIHEICLRAADGSPDKQAFSARQFGVALNTSAHGTDEPMSEHLVHRILAKRSDVRPVDVGTHPMQRDIYRLVPEPPVAPKPKRRIRLVQDTFDAVGDAIESCNACVREAACDADPGIAPRWSSGNKHMKCCTAEDGRSRSMHWVRVP